MAKDKLTRKKGKVGQPMKFPTPEDLQKVIDKYFASTPKAEWTVTGLALEVGSKQTIQDYEARPEYEKIVKKAKLKVENSYELSLRKTGRTGDIFALKNFGWVDKQDHDIKVDKDSFKIGFED